MSDIANIINNIPKENKKQKNIEGILRDTYFFYSWSGYKHPVHLTNPATYEETQIPKEDEGPYAYYEASLDTSGKEPVLIFVEKFIVKRKNINLDIKQSKGRKFGDVYYLCREDNERLFLEKEVTLDETFGILKYAHLIFDDTGKAVKEELILKEFSYSYRYDYDEKGLFRVTVIDSIDGKKVAERGQKQIF